MRRLEQRIVSRAARPVVITAAIAAAVLLLFGSRLVSLYVDYLWFLSTGYRSVFVVTLLTRVVLFFAGAAIFLALFLPNVLLARRVAQRLLRRSPPRLGEAGAPGDWFGSIFGGGGYRPFGPDRPRPFSDLAEVMGGPDAGRWLLERIGGELAIIAGLVLAVVMGLTASGQWESVQRARHAVPFGVTDPVFQRDVAFHVFHVPLLAWLQSWLFWTVLLTLGVVVALYALALYVVDPGLEHAAFYLGNRARAMRSHVLFLVAALALLVGAGIWLDGYDLLLARHDRMVGANFTDLHARLPAIRVLALAAVAGAVAAAVTAFRRDYLPLILSAVLFGAVLVVGRGLLPFVVQRLQVDPAELAQETPYLERNIQFTRLAFGIHQTEEQTFPAEEAVRPDELITNRQTVANIRLWDHRPLKDTYNQIQSIRPYYVFDDIDIDRYVVDGQYRQVMLSARELAPERLGAAAQTWVNRRLQYTHGYGVAMSPVNEVTPEGLPAFFIQDLPPTGKIRVERPQVYYGEQTTGYVLVRSGIQEFDFPRGDQSVFTTYQGESGVRLGPIWRRALLAWYFGDFNLLVSTYLRPDSAVLFRRTVRERVQRLAPFLRLDGDPYLVVADGKLYWMVDGYTTTDRFPYAQRIVERVGPPARETAITGQQTPTAGGAPPVVFRRTAYNYIRNSAKIVVDAYDGSVAIYLADATDPIAQTYAAIFPDVFRPLAEMPASLRQHVRYPEDLFRAQAEILRRYHVQDPQVFYNGEDLWSLPAESTGSQRVPVEPYYVIMRLPGQAREEFVLILPFTPATRDNMVAWLAARSDGAEYGKLLLYKFPRDRLIYGPAQIDARIDQDPTISAQLTLWNQMGSRVIRGNLLVIPIGASTLYVEPIYLQAEASRLPELKRVVLATGNRLVMEPTLGEAIARIFGPETAQALGTGVAPAPPGAAPVAGRAPPETGVTDARAAAAARAAREAYQRALEALRAADFARFGEELRALDERLRELEQAATP